MKTLKIIPFVILLIALFAVPSQAVVKLRLYDGTTTVNVTDGGIGDVNAATGAVTYIGPIGVWDLNVATGATLPLPNGNVSYPFFDLNSIDSSTGAGTLTIMMTDTSYKPAVGLMEMAIGGTTQGSVSYAAWADSWNDEFFQWDFIGSLGPFGPSAFSGSANATLPEWNTYGPNGLFGDGWSFTQIVTITHLGAGTSSFDASLSTVPEPASMVLLGSGLVGLAGWGRKKFRK